MKKYFCDSKLNKQKIKREPRYESCGQDNSRIEIDF